MPDDEYEVFVRGLQKVGAKPLLAAYSSERKPLLALLDKEARQGNLTLVLGAGVSLPSGLPNWKEVTERLIASVMPDRKSRGLARRLARMDLPPYRQTRIVESLSAAFRLTVRDTLYPARLRKNHTLESIARLAKRSRQARKKLSVITYNFDNLLEQHLDGAGLKGKYLVVESVKEYREYRRSPPAITILHPHGYMPMAGDLEALLNCMLVFSERQYHRTYFEKDNWSNAVQRNAFATNACLFAGCSFNDQNLRRLLDQSDVAKSPCLAAIMKRTNRFKRPGMNENTDYIIQHDLALFDVKTLWVKNYSGAVTIFDQLLN